MKFTKLFILAASCIAFFSCQQQYSDEVYSCDPDVDTWVKQNLKDIRVMTRKEWITMDETLKSTVLSAFSPNQKQRFWIEKIDEVLNLDWNNDEREHIEKLRSAVRQNSHWFSDEWSESEDDTFDLFEYQWVEYAREILQWTDKQIGAIAYTGNEMLSKDGLIKKNEMKNIKLKSSGESCDCVIGAFWSNCDSSMSNSVCKSTTCEIRQCGFLNNRTCDGLCMPS